MSKQLPDELLVIFDAPRIKKMDELSKKKKKRWFPTASIQKPTKVEICIALLVILCMILLWRVYFLEARLEEVHLNFIDLIKLMFHKTNPMGQGKVPLWI
jgi:hypothetical protein